MIRVGLIGFGAIGHEVADALVAGIEVDSRLVAVLVRREEAAREITRRWNIAATTNRMDFLSHNLDLVVECAGHAAVRDHALALLERGMALMVTSVGAFADDDLWLRAQATARASGGQLLIPAGGVGGLDVLGAAAVGGLDEVTMRVRKAPDAWFGTPAASLVGLTTLTEVVCIYDGPVREGARRYPQNVNIAAAVALTGIGLDRTRLIIEIDPAATHHVVEVTGSGTFGRFSCRIDNLPSPENPKTGRLVAMALVKAVRRYGAAVDLGV